MLALLFFGFQLLLSTTHANDERCKRVAVAGCDDELIERCVVDVVDVDRLRKRRILIPVTVGGLIRLVGAALIDAVASHVFVLGLRVDERRVAQQPALDLLVGGAR